MVDTQTLLTYLIAAIVLVIAPGPAQALVIARSVEGGARAGILTAVGLEIGTLTHTIAAALGLSAILATSATAFAYVKYAGASYLVVLGLLMLRNSRHVPAIDDAEHRYADRSGQRIVIHGAVTGILNPKVAVFFLAFLPQFVQPERGGVIAQFVALGVILATLGLVFDSALALAVGAMRRRVAMGRRFAAWRERVTGAVLIGLGVRLALVERR